MLVEDILHGKKQVEPCPIPLNSLENVMLNSICRETGVLTLKSRYEQIGGKKSPRIFQFWNFLIVLIITADPNQMIF